MSDRRRERLLKSFVFESMEVPRSYGRRIPLGEFIDEVNAGGKAPYLGDGYLVLDNKFIENSKEWVSRRVMLFEGEYLSLEDLNEEIEGLQVFWVSATELLS